MILRDRRVSAARTWGRALYTSVTGNAQAFGFSITVTVTFQVVSSAEGPPSSWQMMLFALATVAAFSVLNVLLAAVIDPDAVKQESARVVLVATATDFLAVGAGIAVAMGWVRVVDGWAAWVLAPFSAGVVYVVVQAVELYVGRKEEARREEG